MSWVIIKDMLGIFTKIQKKKLRQYLQSIRFKDGKVLDVGCGSGKYADLFDQNYVGIDKEVKEIELARKKNKGGHFEIMNATTLKLPDKNFDLVFSIGVFHHLSDKEVIEAFIEVFRVTKENGHILIVDLVLPKQMKLLAYPAFWLDKGAHRRSFEQLINLLSNAFVPRFKMLYRFISIGVVVMEWEK